MRRGQQPDFIEVSESEEPKLFAFLHRIADDAGAPRPHRVFLSGRVNAAVFYDFGLWNFLFPSKKNLEIGLGLVNVLTLDELKAVLAHEFGHFAQRTMTVGSWVYVSQQFAGELVTRRDAFDGFLDVVSRIDLRVAWIGWAMKLVVWSIRSIVDTAFRGVVLLQRALSRQMEFQADLVSVSLTGSDSLVHALHRLGAADEGWELAMRFCAHESEQARPVADVFAIQNRFLDHLRALRGDARFGLTPARPEGARGDHRVFAAGLADVPKMWSTHPSNADREENAKRTYLPSVMDERSAWAVFTDEAAMRARASSDLRKRFGLVSVAQAAAANDATAATGPVPIDESLARVDEMYRSARLQPRFRGCYLDRSLARHARKADDLTTRVDEDRAALIAELERLYPDTLGKSLAAVRELDLEKAQLEALQDGFLEAPGGVIRHRGRDVRRSELAGLVASTTAELAEAEEVVWEHDRRVRGVHRAAARLAGLGWEEWLTGLLRVVHYAEHAEADLEDARGHVGNVVAVITADGSVSSSEMQRLRDAAQEVVDAVHEVWNARKQVALNGLAPRIGVSTWAEALPNELRLFQPPANEGYSGAWFQAMDSWIDVLAKAMRVLRGEALEALIEGEDRVAGWLRDGTCAAEAAPVAPGVPDRFPRRGPNDLRPRQKKLGWWDSFATATGWGPATARLAVASCVLGPVLVGTWTVGGGTVAVHNGLGIPVRVRVGDEVVVVEARSDETVSGVSGSIPVRAETLDGRVIEEIEGHVSGAFGHAQYNVAGASVMAAFRDGKPVPLGHPSWPGSDAGGVYLDREDLGVQLEYLADVSEAPVLALSHALWDPIVDPAWVNWATLASRAPTGATQVAGRLRDEGALGVGARAVQMDIVAAEERARLCEEYARLAAARPDDADLAYLDVRCRLTSPESESGWLEAHQRFPRHSRLARAAAMMLYGTGRWAEADSAYRAALADPALVESLTNNELIAAARVRRAAASFPNQAALADLRSSCKALQYLEQLSSHYTARMTEEGRLAEAAASTEEPWEEVLVGLSVGADPQSVQTALSVPLDLLWSGHVLPSYVLASREAATDLPDRRRWILSMYGEQTIDPVLAALDGDDPTVLDAAVVGLDPLLRGSARVAGILRFGDRAPAEWRREAEALLFPAERPYLGPP